MFLYDALLDLDREIQLVWRSPGTIASRFYLANRYLMVVSICLSLVTIIPISDTSANGGRAEIVIERMALLGPAAFTTLRVYALSGKKRCITSVVLVLSLGPFIVNMSALYQDHVVNSAPPVLCIVSVTDVNPSGFIALTVASRGSLILAELLAVIVTWRETREKGRQVHGALSQLSFKKVLLNRGIVYFCSLAVLNIVGMTLSVLNILVVAREGNYVTVFIDPLSALLVCRFLLDLRGVSEQLAGESELGNISSLDFGGVGSHIPTGGPAILGSSPELDEDEPLPTRHSDQASTGRPSESPTA
ncbi:hypothetical protein BD413DRAFT_620066 [Trametes elegans]|nr:hypothetical protein BD413DRAFT_620066 [Trametes elegans]